MLPSLRRSDISPSFPTVHIRHSSRSGVPLQTSAQVPQAVPIGGGECNRLCVRQATNSLVYLKCISNSKLLSPRSQQLLPLYTTLVPSLGTEHSSYEEVSLQRRLHSGHISLGSCVFSLCDDMHSGKEIIALSASALSRNFPETLNLSTDTHAHIIASAVVSYEGCVSIRYVLSSTVRRNRSCAAVGDGLVRGVLQRSG